MIEELKLAYEKMFAIKDEQINFIKNLSDKLNISKNI